MDPHKNISSHLAGVALATFSMFLFSVTYAFYKGCGPFISTAQTIYLQASFSLLLILPFALRKGLPFLISEHLGKIFLRTIFGLLGLYCIVQALKTTELVEVSLLNNTAPLLVPLLLWALHRTVISLSLWSALLVGFAGVFTILRPGFETIHIGLVLAAMSGLFSAGLLIVARMIAHEPFFRVLFYQYLLTGLILLPIAYMQWRAPPNIVWFYLVSAAVSNIFAQVMLIAAVRKATSQEVAPFIYTTVIFSGIIGWIVWKEVPDLISLIGMLVVCVGGLWSIALTRRSS